MRNNKIRLKGLKFWSNQNKNLFEKIQVIEWSENYHNNNNNNKNGDDKNNNNKINK
jgi:hypothetical protein